MAGKKDTTIFYQNQVDICKKYLNAEQFGRLMYALFEVEDGKCPEVADDIIIAFEFMSLQQRLDQEKYAKRCETNRKNGLKGGAPKGNKNASKQPKQPNAKKNNPNEDDNEDEDVDENDNGNDNENENDVLLGTHGNVKLSTEEYQSLQKQFPSDCERMINRLSRYMDHTGKTYKDHYHVLMKWAEEDNVRTLEDRLKEAGVI